MKYFYIFFYLFTSYVDVSAQRIDTLGIRQAIDSARAYGYNDPAKVMRFAQSALNASGESYYYGKLNALQLIADAYYQTGKMDSALMTYHLALNVSRSHPDINENGNNYTGLATIFTDSGKPDSALAYCTLALDAFRETKDSSSLCDILLRCGNVYSSLGNHDKAIAFYMQSLRICEAIRQDLVVAYNYCAIGIIHDKQGDYAGAEEYFLKAQKEYQRIGDLFGQMTIANNLGILYKNIKDYDKSLQSYQLCLFYADSLHLGKGQMGAHTNLGILYNEMGLYEIALHHARIGLGLAEEFQNRETYADNLNSLARAQIGLKDFPAALQNAKASLRIGKEVQSLEKQRDENLTLSNLYAALQNYEQSLTYYKAYTIVKDSLFSIDRTKKISELEAVYQSEKKDKEIQLLVKNAEIDRFRKKLLWVGLCLSLLAGGLLVYSQWVRRVRDKKIRIQEKVLEEQQRRTLELENEKVTRELDFKKQELAAKALQLARKNEFLQSLNTQVEKIKDDTEGLVSDSARRIARQIRIDVASEEDWEQFLSSFRDVHRDFIEQLLVRYPDVSPGEMRHACLMKMNLSAKEIAAMLNITPEGVKKSRYRLRKKLNMDSDTDIQLFLLSFPSDPGEEIK